MAPERCAKREVDTEFQCPDCSIRFQVYGIFGYCPGCSCENLQIYDVNWANIKRRLSTEPDRDRQLRHTYRDLVSTFEVFCNRKAKRLTSDSASFRVLFDARKFFKNHANTDILANVTGPSLLPRLRPVSYCFGPARRADNVANCAATFSRFSPWFGMPLKFVRLPIR